MASAYVYAIVCLLMVVVFVSVACVSSVRQKSTAKTAPACKSCSQSKASPMTNRTKVTDYAKRPRIVFSMTTTPGRFAHVHSTVESLIRSSLKPDAVYLHLPKVSSKTGELYPVVLSDELIQLAKKHSNVLRINRIDSDVGPFTKLWPTLAMEPDESTLIITADDDEWYPPKYHMDLVQAALDRPDWAVAYRGIKVTDPTKGRYEFINGNDDYVEVDVLEGYTGAVYRRGFFSTDIEPPAPDSPCMTTDDIWVSSYLRSRGVPRVLIPGGLPMGHPGGLGNAKYPMSARPDVAAIDPLSAGNYVSGNRNVQCLCETWLNS